MMDEPHIIIFDGVCNFCSGAVYFIIKRDPHRKFAFTPMQGKLATGLIEEFEVARAGTDTLVLIKNGKCFIRSTAALEIAKDLRGCWFLLNIFVVIPTPIRDAFYNLFSRYRYRLFGKKSRCMVPSSSVKSRFIGM